jgi:hypothetical protein
MSYKDQKKKWLSEHPEATPDDAYEEGYRQSTLNWCNHIR